jgi:hypothetical protein
MYVCKDCNIFYVKLRKRKREDLGASGTSWFVTQSCLEHGSEHKGQPNSQRAILPCAGIFEAAKVIVSMS